MLGATNALAMVAGHDARAADDVARSAASYLEQRLWPDQLAEAARGVGAWLWHGYLGAGRMTLLTSQWKAGKTTLLANLVARMARGGTLAGLPVAAAKVAILSEEGPSNWAGALPQALHRQSRQLFLPALPGPPFACRLARSA